MKFTRVLTCITFSALVNAADFLDGVKRAEYFEVTDYNVPTFEVTMPAKEYEEMKSIIQQPTGIGGGIGGQWPGIGGGQWPGIGGQGGWPVNQGGQGGWPGAQQPGNGGWFGGWKKKRELQKREAEEEKLLEKRQQQGGAMDATKKDFKTKNASLVFTLNGEAQSFEKVTFSLAGVSSQYYKRQAFNIKIGNKQLLYGRKQFRIRSDAREPTMIRSKLFCDVMGRLGLKNAMSANYIKLSINGEDLGFYVIMDSLKLSYVEIEYGDVKSTNLLQCKDLNAFLTSSSGTTCMSENEDNPDTSAFKQLLSQLDRANSISQMESYFDYENFLKVTILEWLTGSWDHYTLFGHNYNVYKIPNGKWEVSLYDFDATWGQDLGLGLMLGGPRSISANNVNSWPNAKYEEWIQTQKQHPLSVIMQDKNLFLKNLQYILDKAFNPALLFERIDILKEFITPYVRETKSKGLGNLNPSSVCSDYTFDEFNKSSEFTTIDNQFIGSPSHSYGLKQWILDKYRFVCKNYSVTCDQRYLNGQLPTSTKPSVPVNTRKPNPTGTNNGGNNENGGNGGNDSCWATSLGYKCCSNPNTESVYEDESGEWGVENNDWCGIIKAVPCWAEKLGYKCCSSCVQVYYDDQDGRWGVENNDWCGIPTNC